jgi:hypothetical protein
MRTSRNISDPVRSPNEAIGSQESEITDRGTIYKSDVGFASISSAFLVRVVGVSVLAR